MDLKAKSFNLNMNANQYLVKNTVNSISVETAGKKVSQASQTPVEPLLSREYELHRKEKLAAASMN